ncbi:hypothetical protein PANTOEA_21980 [Pantoea dispersa]|jgi:hypothetical protein|uniref:Uncharacterized protein n=1 Tax=Pantoea dispersa TaxID=59814 RepID=A0ABY2ZU11_9GAMM|nr:MULTISPECIES: hypothetical protein [Pantoea]MBZ6392243.1 hypothetical protein [Pantoea dispersa]MCW0323825.1 hypothetical protein [Pantoea dispersa]MCW0328563.1 hypothetical protein [Pantoea dispersa]MCW0434986.1 hypothetical protein [Pantoea dispersa]NIG36668.1 hypothetical protein [Pantoea sp. Ap-959]
MTQTEIGVLSLIGVLAGGGLINLVNFLLESSRGRKEVPPEEQPLRRNDLENAEQDCPQEARGILTKYRLILSAAPGGLQRGIPDMAEALADRFEGHPPAESAGELRGSANGVNWQLKECPEGELTFYEHNFQMVRTLHWIDEFRDFRPNQDRDWLTVLIQTDSLLPNRGLSFFLSHLKYRMSNFPERHRVVMHEQCGMCYCSYPAIPNDGEGHEPLRQVTLSCTVAPGKLQSVIPEFLRNYGKNLLEELYWNDQVSSIDCLYGGPRRGPQTLPDHVKDMGLMQGWQKQEDEVGRGGGGVLWSAHACVMTFTSPFFRAETPTGCVEPIAWKWHQGLNTDSAVKQDRLWAVLEADAWAKNEELVERFTELAAALEQGITEKAEKQAAGGWAFRTFRHENDQAGSGGE